MESDVVKVFFTSFFLNFGMAKKVVVARRRGEKKHNITKPKEKCWTPSECTINVDLTVGGVNICHSGQHLQTAWNEIVARCLERMTVKLLSAHLSPRGCLWRFVTGLYFLI